MTTYKNTLIGYLLLISLTACGGGGGGGAADTPVNNTTSGQYDLVDYLFDQSLAITSNTVEYPVSVYDKTTGELSVEYTDHFEKTIDDTIVWTSSSEPASTYVITATSINETVHSANNSLRANQRFVDIGTEYMNANADLPPLGTQNARCSVTGHHATVDLASLTGAFSLVAGSYSDVLEINCITSFVVDSTLAEHTNLTHYYARDMGLIFTEGQLLFFGDVYIIPGL